MRDKVIIIISFVLLLAGCSETKYVPEGQYLMDKAKVVNDSKEPLSTLELRQYVLQRGNSQWFSTAKIPLMTYSLSGRDTTKWYNRTLRSIGEPPQLYDSLSTLQSMVNLQTQMQNMGYLQAGVETQMLMKGRRIKTTYILHPGILYRLRKADYVVQDSTIADLLRANGSASRNI